MSFYASVARLFDPKVWTGRDSNPRIQLAWPTRIPAPNWRRLPVSGNWLPMSYDDRASLSPTKWTERTGDASVISGNSPVALHLSYAPNRAPLPAVHANGGNLGSLSLGPSVPAHVAVGFPVYTFRRVIHEPFVFGRIFHPRTRNSDLQIYSGSCAVPSSSSRMADVSAFTSTASFVQSVVSGRSRAFSIPARKSRLVSSVAMAR